jgi:hypothetical protein
MKPKNFPARKLKRQLEAQGLNPDNHKQELDFARQKRTKKRRG